MFDWRSLTDGVLTNGLPTLCRGVSAGDQTRPVSVEPAASAAPQLSCLAARSVTRLISVSVAAILGLTAVSAAQADGPPTPDEYISYVGGDAKLVAPGQLVLDGVRQICGRRPTVLDSQLDDYGAAYPGFLIMNPRLLQRVSTPVKFWIYAHECGHQFRGPDEETADCFAVQRGRRQGWLSPDGLEEVCEFIRPARGDMMHLSGSHRCEYMRECYADPRVR